TSLCKSRDKGDDEINALINEKKSAITNSVNRGNPKDDLKLARGEIYNAAKKILEANDFGSNANVFCRDIMAPLVDPGTSVYQELKNDIFGTN
ncbi:MAG: hypothetical protein IIA63_11415, partial [Nitrospinae bacterium]|nr:hypothetical protein [Nitrospinota bacterium]